MAIKKKTTKKKVTKKKVTRKKAPVKKTTRKKTTRKAPAKRVNYTPAIVNRLCDWLISGKSLRSFCSKTGTPSKSTVMRWLLKFEDFRDQYAIARTMQAETHVDEMIEIADTECKQPIVHEGKAVEVNGKILMTVTSAGVSHARLRIETRKWVAVKMAPKKYGEQEKHVIKSPEGTGVLKIPTIATMDEWDKMNDENNADLLEKEKVYKVDE